MTDNIHPLDSSVPFQDLCGKALSEVPGAEAAAERLSEVFGFPLKSIRTQSQLAAALVHSDKILAKITKILGPVEQRDPVKAAGASKYFEAYNTALEIMLKCFAESIVPMIKDKGDLASKQAIRLFGDLAQGKSDASAEQWQHLERLIEHATSQQNAVSTSTSTSTTDKEKS